MLFGGGVQIDEDLQNMVRTTIVVSGVKTQDEYSERAIEKIDVADMENMSSEVESDPLDDFIDGTF